MRTGHITILRRALQKGDSDKQANTAAVSSGDVRRAIRAAVPVAVVAVLLAVVLLPLLAPAAAGKDVDVTLIAKAVDWHVGAPTAASKPEISMDPGDRLVLQVHNHDAMDHTFTFTHFAVDLALAPGSDANPTIISVTINTSQADVGRWQFYCAIPGHAPGTNESRVGMVGWVRIGVAPPPTPGFEVALVIAALGIAAVAMRVLPRRKT